MTIDTATITTIISISTALLTIGMVYGIMRTQLSNIQKELKESKEEQEKMTALMVEHIKDDLKRLEKKQDKHNNLIERVGTVERAATKAHKRLDDFVQRG